MHGPRQTGWVPRADHLSLTADLAMPDVNHLSNTGTSNVVLDRHFAGLPAKLAKKREFVGLFENMCRLVDKALREYAASRAELLAFVNVSRGQMLLSAYLRAIDHMENCVGATHRAVMNATALREARIGGGAPRQTERQEERLRYFRNATEHSDARLLGIIRSRQFGPDEPFSIRLANTSIVIGSDVLTYKELVSAMTKCHKTIEVIRGVATGDPSPEFPKDVHRTQDRRADIVAASGQNFSDYFRQLARLARTHA
jgi:hypothetical protein